MKDLQPLAYIIKNCRYIKDAQSIADINDYYGSVKDYLDVCEEVGHNVVPLYEVPDGYEIVKKQVDSGLV